MRGYWYYNTFAEWLNSLAFYDYHSIGGFREDAHKDALWLVLRPLHISCVEAALASSSALGGELPRSPLWLSWEAALRSVHGMTVKARIRL